MTLTKEDLAKQFTERNEIRILHEKYRVMHCGIGCPDCMEKMAEAYQEYDRRREIYNKKYEGIDRIA